MSILNLKTIVQKSTLHLLTIRSKICRQSIQHLSKTCPKSTKNGPKSIKNKSLQHFRRQIAPRSAPRRSPSYGVLDFYRIFCRKWHAKDDFVTPLDPKWLQTRTFEPRSALGPSKNDLWKGVRKKHEKLTKNRCENGTFLMAQNHVWRYTLRL